MNQKNLIVFVCEHGAAKSILAATYFNKLAKESNLNLHAIARGTNPDQELSPTTIEGLRQDGMTPTESTAQKLMPADLESAERIIAFCDLPEEYQNTIPIEHWNNIPPVSENYEKARDVIVEHIHRLLNN